MEHPGETSAGWVKYEGNPVLGGDLGTCFDVSVIRTGGRFLMWFSWRPKKSIALTESADGIHWEEPVIAPAPASSGWERHPANPIIRPGGGWDSDAVYKPYALFLQGRCYLWYNGRRGGAEQIGLAFHKGRDLGFG